MKKSYTLKTYFTFNSISFSLVFKNTLSKNLLLFVYLGFACFTFAQMGDSAKYMMDFKGAVNVTNKGISMIPTFSLGKPAVAFFISMSRKNLSFEPELRFAIDGKPWGFIFWGRYKLLKTDRFLINAGAHPAIVFKTAPVQPDGVSKTTTVAKHYLAGELSPNYLLTKNISVGIYYLYSHGIENDAVQNTHFLTINSNFSHIKLTNQFYMKVTPQFYYLKMDKRDGFYFTTGFTWARKNFPLSVSSVINKTIQTDITASKDFVWNINLTYSFSKKYLRV